MKIKYFAAALGCAALCAACFAAGYSLTRPEAGDFPDNEAAEVLADAESSAARITGATKMIYEYHYLDDGTTERSEEAPPYFLVNLDGGGLREMFVDWEIVSFSAERVVMRKNIADKVERQYVVGVLNGYVAVFYSQSREGASLKELLNMPVSALPEAERTRLEKGIRVIGDEALVRILQDYGS
ncbi:MAG: BofC C-terminal domain-containing protein [Clostridiales bacterium]|jgi:hypothetical protein|nr:BofC C-terminal domain-containing protein [Clostridiales bacterium]